jgi:predicted PurR-regulated permease PerM
LAFWFLGITGALLWAVLMAFLSLLPAAGAVPSPAEVPQGSSER